MNLKQLIDAVNEDLGESYPNATITRWINEGYCALSDIVKPEKRVILTDDADVSDVVEIKHITTASGYELNPLALNDFSSMGYVMVGDTIELRNVNEVVYLYYYTELQPLSDPTESPKIPQQFHDILIHYAVARLQFTEDELESRPDRMNGYNNRLADLKRHYETKRATGSVQTLGVVYYA